MHEFIEAFRFIAHDGAVAGQPALPSLGYLTLQTLKVGAIGLAISLAIAIPLGVALVVNLPGSPKAARESLEVLIPVLAHAVELLQGESGEGGHRNPV